MEIKKTAQADLEQTRMTAFLLGLILVLAVIFVAFEYTDRVDGEDMTEDLADQLDQDLDMTPLQSQQNRIALMPRTASASHVSQKIKVVTTDVELPSKQEIANVEGNTDNPHSQAGMTDEANAVKGEEDQTTALDPNATDLKDNPLNFHIVEDLPQFPGGAVEMMKWLTKNLRYPVLARDSRIQGKVIVQFVVNKDGTVSNIQVQQSVDPLLDREALRVVRMMPKWKAGIQRDKPCRTRVVIPVVFSL